MNGDDAAAGMSLVFEALDVADTAITRNKCDAHGVGQTATGATGISVAAMKAKGRDDSLRFSRRLRPSK